jgi:hypothetical protein
VYDDVVGDGWARTPDELAPPASSIGTSGGQVAHVHEGRVTSVATAERSEGGMFTFHIPHSNIFFLFCYKPAGIGQVPAAVAGLLRGAED